MSNGNSKENPDKEEEGEDTGEIRGGVGLVRKPVRLRSVKQFQGKSDCVK